MAEIALINIDKREVVDPTETGYGYKMKEAIANRMSLDIIWLFAVPAAAQPEPGAAAEPTRTRRGRAQATSPKRVPLGHWAGDRVLIVDEYAARAEDRLPADVLAQLPQGDPEDDVLAFALEHLTHIDMPRHKHTGADDALFPADAVWVVRNLTKRWYARSDVLVAAKDSRGPAVARGMGLGDLIWTEIGGGSVGKSSIGQTLDIQMLATVESPAEGEQWEDRSTKAKALVTKFNQWDDVRELRG
ncbi:hypothetical protein C8R46DRAFT_1255047 [Mycena filopes]|nr:hypothetical protein C8R46DRAFT_1255047 [Mycena filopes]